MKRLNNLFVFLILEVLSVVIAAAAFALIPSKVIAGGVAGGYFLLFSIFMLLKILKWPKFWTAWTFYPTVFFLFGIAIPMLWQRFTHIGLSFNDIRVWGIPSPEFHHVASSTLGLLFLVTLAETLQQIVKGKKAAR